MWGKHHWNKSAVVLGAALLAVIASSVVVQAATIPPPYPEGTWTSAGNPYYVSSDIEIQVGKTLVIEPGVEVVMGPGVQMLVNGQLNAVGTYDVPITFRGVTDSNYWNTIRINYNQTRSESKIEYCNFSDSSNAIFLHVDSIGVSEMEIQNCTFKNIIGSGVYSYIVGNSSTQPPHCIAKIRNCRFEELNYGCYLISEHYYHVAFQSSVVEGNIFSNRGIHFAGLDPHVVVHTFHGSVSKGSGRIGTELFK
ncbi:hypothetical protein PDESU_00636 [Pontiella desulfatans]|uniref:Right handed beta helix domain-containing protein n=1 Tax=Pontiella desulfatans TaxID=2750659 RepID=A0A6C2TXT6_PONDE|nr:hypothetical protein [Pontiella desulfatans]VGO12086.1 hypothetical protein PDESU_00636 [Pontiella desulfatans]